MEMQLNKGCCNMPLKNSCIIVAAYFLISLGFTLAFDLNTNVVPLVLLALIAIANISLLIGALRRNKQFVFVWLVVAVIYFIHWPVELLGCIFEFGGYRTDAYKDSLFVFVFVHVIDLIISLYCAVIVYSFHKELKNAEPEMSSVPTA